MAADGQTTSTFRQSFSPARRGRGVASLIEKRRYDCVCMARSVFAPWLQCILTVGSKTEMMLSAAHVKLRDGMRCEIRRTWCTFDKNDAKPLQFSSHFCTCAKKMFKTVIIASPLGRGRSIAIGVSVCLSVFLPVCELVDVSKTHARTSQNFLYMLPVGVARSSLMTVPYIMYFRFCG